MHSYYRLFCVQYGKTKPGITTTIATSGQFNNFTSIVNKSGAGEVGLSIFTSIVYGLGR